MKAVLTIAGSDSSGGAGIQADMKTMMANGVYAMSAITSLTAQNTTGIRDVYTVTPEFLGEQLDAVFEDIPPAAVKIGMMAEAELIHVTAEKLKQYQPAFVVLDPVMVSSSGTRLISKEAVGVWERELFPLATLVTPNIPETEVLTKRAIRSRKDMEEAAEEMREAYHCAVLLKGGHFHGDAADFLTSDQVSFWFENKRIDNPNTHGTGCTLSSAIAANLAKGFSLENSVRRAKEYITGCIEAGLDLGEGSGPLNHSYPYAGYFMEEADNE